MRKFPPNGHRTVGEGHGHAEHLRRQVAVAEPAPPHRTAPGRVDADPDRPDERLEPDRLLDGARETGRRRGRDWGAQVLVEGPTQLDAGLEEEALPDGKLGVGERPFFLAPGWGLHRSLTPPRPRVSGPKT